MATRKIIPANSNKEIVIQVPGSPQNTVSARVVVPVDMNRQYVARRMAGLLPALSTLAHASDDVTAELGIDVYTRMLADSEVAAGINLLVMAATSNPLIVVPPIGPEYAEYQTALKIAQFFQWMFDNMRTPTSEWRSAIIKEALVYGSGVGEIMLDIQKGGPWDGLYKVDRISYTAVQETSFVVDNFNDVIGLIPLKQMHIISPIGMFVALDSTGTNTDKLAGLIPREKFVIFTWQPRSNDPRGRSQLRNVYSAWYTKQQILELLLIWYKKFAMPSYWGTVPENAAPICYTDENGNEIKIQPTEQMLDAMQTIGNASVIALPFGSAINQLEASQGASVFFEGLVWADRQITRGILMQHMATSDSEHMARTSAATHQDVLSLFIVHLRRWQADQIRRDIIIPLMKANFGPDYLHLAPQLDLGEGDGFPITPNEVAQLQNAGYFTADQMPHLDKIIGVPVRKVVEPGVRPYTAPAEPHKGSLTELENIGFEHENSQSLITG